MSTEDKLIHGIAVRERATRRLVEFIQCETGRRALKILSGRRANLDNKNYRAEEAYVKQSEIEAIER